MWHRETAKLRAEGRLSMVGIVEEQHPDRAQLFHRWQEFDWPALVDAGNLLEVTVVPIHALVDANGVIIGLPKNLAELEAMLPATTPAAAPAGAVEPPDLASMRATAGDDPKKLRRLGDAAAIWETPSDAIAAYERAVALAPIDANARFRLGVALKRRSESPAREPGDFSRAVAAWGEALAQSPSQYIWRRRLQQYGPRPAKPYPFYDWVDEARDAITARGETPPELAAELTESERLGPARVKGAAGAGDADPASGPPPRHPDPEGKIPVDSSGLVAIEATVIPARAIAGDPVRLHVSFRLDRAREAHWEDGAGPLEVWIELPAGWSADQRAAKLLGRDPGARTMPRAFETELYAAASGTAPVTATVKIVALYPVCEGAEGTCRFLRSEVELSIPVSAPEPRRRAE